MNIEETIIKYLNGKLEEKVYADVPKERPFSFVTVERTGGGLENVVIDHANLAIQSWHKDGRYSASELAEKVDTVMAKIDVLGIMKVERTGIYNFPDPDYSMGRYQGTYDITYYKEEI